MKKLLYIILLCLLPSFVFATDYYVCGNGTACNVQGTGWITGTDDTAAGRGESKGDPWKSVPYAQGQISGKPSEGCGDTLIIGGGAYTDLEDTTKLLNFDDGQNCSAEAWFTVKGEFETGTILSGIANQTVIDGVWFENGNHYIRVENIEIHHVEWGVRLNVDEEDGITNIYLYRLKIHDIEGEGGVSNRAYSENLTVDSCTIYNIYGRDSEEDLNYWTHNHCMYLKGKDILVKNTIMYQPEGGMAVRIDGYSGNAPVSHSIKLVNNTIYGIQEPPPDYPNPNCCGTGGYDDPHQVGVINIFKAAGADNGPAKIYIENNVFIDPPGINEIGYGPAINVGNNGEENCVYGSYTQTLVYINNNVATGLMTTDNPNCGEDAECVGLDNPWDCCTGSGTGNCTGDWGSFSSNTINATLTDDITAYPYPDYDFTLKAGGDDLDGEGLDTNAPDLDYAGETRPNPPSIGAYELESTPALSIQGVSIQ